MPDDRIYYSEALVRSLEGAVRAAYSSPHAQLSRLPPKGNIGRFNVELAHGQRIFRAADASSDQWLIEIGGDGIPLSMFHLAFKASFDIWQPGRRSRHILEHISLSVFQKLETNDLIRMFRAEWDGRETAGRSKGHAQPHWHFAMEADDFRAAMGDEHRNAGQSLDFGTTLQQESLVDFTKFHFAMSAPWQSNAPRCHCQVVRSDAEIVAWLRNLSQYIVEQLAYISGKLGISEGRVRDFG
jgi:hypothetical protein